jgi:hypothetical protein
LEGGATIGELTDLLCKKAGAALVPEESARRLVMLASRLRFDHGGVSLECHLGARDGRADLVVRLFRDEAIGVRGLSAPELGAAISFAAAWTAPESALRGIPYVDLEFDMDRDEPACFVGAVVDRRVAGGVRADAGPGSRGDGSEYRLAKEALLAGQRTALDARTLDRVRDCYEALGGDAFVSHVGSLQCRRREGDWVRLIVSLGRRQVRSYLESLRWPGDLFELDACLSRYVGARGSVDIDLNVTEDGLLGETGFYRTFWDGETDRESFVHLVDELLKQGVATEIQAETLAAFQASNSTEEGRLPGTVTVKIKQDAAGHVSAKAYLSQLRSR